MIEAIAGIGTAFGLSGSAGLNAYIPLLIVALAGRFPTSDPLIELSSPYDLLSSWWVIGLLVILLVIEMTVDKIPAVDTLNDGIQTFVRPVAGAILFAGSSSAINDMNPILAILAGVLVAGGVHATKGLVRPHRRCNRRGHVPSGHIHPRSGRYSCHYFRDCYHPADSPHQERKTGRKYLTANKIIAPITQTVR